MKTNPLLDCMEEKLKTIKMTSANNIPGKRIISKLPFEYCTHPEWSPLPWKNALNVAWKHLAVPLGSCPTRPSWTTGGGRGGREAKGRHPLLSDFLATPMLIIGLFMAALWNGTGHYIFALWFLSFFFFSSLNFSGRRLDVYHLPHMVWP